MQESKQKTLARTLGARFNYAWNQNNVGTGIFVLTGVVAAKHSGPAIILSFAIAALACAFAAFCYAEFASSVPVSGSVYTYTYATMGKYSHF